MSWNTSRFNITELSVGSNHLWTPDVVVVNSADGKYSRNREHYALILRHDGTLLSFHIFSGRSFEASVHLKTFSELSGFSFLTKKEIAKYV
jgi:hypothetical protein